MDPTTTHTHRYRYIIVSNVVHFRLQNELPKIIKDRAKPHITLEELEKLMKWKLSVGCSYKYNNPFLAQLIANKENLNS